METNKFIRQLTVFVENQPGRLADIIGILSEGEIDIRALSVADTTDFGILRLIVNHPNQAERELSAAGYTVNQTEVLGIGIDDQPGGLHVALEALKEANISVEYMYAFVSRKVGTAFVIIRVADNAAARELLQSKGVRILNGEEL